VKHRELRTPREDVKMKRSTAGRLAYATLIALPLLPAIALALNASPMAMFFTAAMAFIVGVLLLIRLFAASSAQFAGSPPVVEPFRFTIRDLLCLTTVLFGVLMFMMAGFRCEAAEIASRPDPLPAIEFRQFVWELESGLACVTVGGVIWIRSALSAAPSEERKSG
jgi:hypothetical protein